MVAYSFQGQFEAPILTLRKTGTIRAVGRRRHARPDEALQLYRGMRTRQCRLIARSVCAAVDPIQLFFHDTPRVLVGTPDQRREIANLDAFAQGDGFANWDEMAAFWRAVHTSRLGPWTGLWIRWKADTVALP